MAASLAAKGKDLSLTVWYDKDLDCKVVCPLNADAPTPVSRVKQWLAKENPGADAGDFGLLTPCGQYLSDGDDVPQGLAELEVCEPRLTSEATEYAMDEDTDSDSDSDNDLLAAVEDSDEEGDRHLPVHKKLSDQRNRWSASTMVPPSDSSSEESGSDSDSDEDDDLPLQHCRSLKTRLTLELASQSDSEEEEGQLIVCHRRTERQRLTLDFDPKADLDLDLNEDDDEAIVIQRRSSKSKQKAAPPPPPGSLELALPSGTFGLLMLPTPGCTVAACRQSLSNGEVLGDKVHYLNKLQYHKSVQGAVEPEPLQDTDTAPQAPETLAVFGPTSVLKMLEMALIKKVGCPDFSRPAKLPEAEEIKPLPTEGAGRTSAVEFCHLSLQGHRPNQEDRALACADVPGCEGWASLFGVFDGHGGPQVSDFVARRMPALVSEKLLEHRGDPRQALTEAFVAVDRELRTRGGSRGIFDLMGCTATVVLVLDTPGEGRWLYCAGAGDSRALLCREGRAVELTRDHSPELPDEEQRIRAAGGRVTSKGRIALGRGSDGGLNVTRALGDFAYKAQRLSAEKQILIPHPEIVAYPIQEGDELFAIGSDGVFEGQDTEGVAESLRDALVHGDSMECALRGQLEDALGSGDNVTLCVGRFRGQGPKGAW